MRVVDDARGPGRPAQTVGSEDHALVDADAVHDAREGVESRRSCVRGVRRGTLAARSHEVVRPPGRLEQVHVRSADAVSAHLGEHGRLERLDDERKCPVAPAGRAQLGGDRPGDVETERPERRGVLDLEHDADLAPLVEGCRAYECEHIREPQRRLRVVETRAARPEFRQSLPAPQGLQLGPREVLGEPAFVRDAVDGLRRAAVGELGARGDVRRRADLVLVAHDEHPVAREHDIGLDRIDAEGESEVVGRAGVLGAITRGAAVSDHERMTSRHPPRLVTAGGGPALDPRVQSVLTAVSRTTSRRPR